MRFFAAIALVGSASAMDIIEFNRVAHPYGERLYCAIFRESADPEICNNLDNLSGA